MTKPLLICDGIERADAGMVSAGPHATDSGGHVAGGMVASGRIVRAAAGREAPDSGARVVSAGGSAANDDLGRIALRAQIENVGAWISIGAAARNVAARYATAKKDDD